VNVLVDGFEKALSNPSRLKRKNVFFAGRGVFSLDPPFNGRPQPPPIYLDPSIKVTVL